MASRVPGHSERPTRVLEVAEAAGGGIFDVLRTISNGVAAAGHDVLVVVGQRPETPADVAGMMDAGVAVEELQWASRNVATQVDAARALRALVRSWQPDVVHLHSAFAGVVGSLVTPRRVPVVYTPHGSPTIRLTDAAPKRAAYRLVEAAVARRATVVGAVSEAEADVVRQELHARRVRVVVNGIPDLDPGAAPTIPERSGRPQVVVTGRVVPQRQPAAAAEILSSVREVADVAWIGGAPGGEDAPVLAAGIPVTGWLAHNDALRQLGAATVCLHWSAWDGLPLAVLEAMARDVVVIASDIPANREILGPRQVAGGVEEAKDLVRRVVLDEELRASLLVDQRRARVRFSAQACVAGWLDVYRDCLRGQV